MKTCNRKIGLIIGVSILTLVICGVSYIMWDVRIELSGTTLKEVYESVPQIAQRLANYEVEELILTANDEKDIGALYIYSPMDTNKTVVLMHRIGTNVWRHFKNVWMYLENGYNVLIYNQLVKDEIGNVNLGKECGPMSGLHSFFAPKIEE